MNGQSAFREKFDALDAAMRAALVFRYREGLPPAHVAQLVEIDAERLGPRLEQALTGLQNSGALAPPGATTAGAQEVLRHELDESRDDPALSSFALIAEVRAERRQRRFLLERLVWQISASTIVAGFAAVLAVALTRGR